MASIRIKSINNDVCGRIDCNNRAIVELTFGLGFRAKFCGKCKVSMVKEGIAFEEARNE